MSAIDDLTTSSDLDTSYLDRRIDDWGIRLRTLYASVQNWLPAGWSVKSEPSMMMHEELMRTHDMPARYVTALNLESNSGKSASLTPKGLWIIGANGRVDLRTPNGSYILVDVAESFLPSDWRVAPVADRSRTQPFDQNSLQAILS